MKLLVTRKTFSELSTIGELAIDGAFFGHTLEPPKREDKPCCIPLGTYDVSIRFSEKHKRLIPHVENVPGFTEIEIHIGNFPKDTEGCLLVGNITSSTPDQILGSKVAFDCLFGLLSEAKEKAEPITITYREADDVFIQSLTDYLKKFSEGNEPTVPLFKNGDGSINREKTLALPCFAEFK